VYEPAGACGAAPQTHWRQAASKLVRQNRVVFYVTLHKGQGGHGGRGRWRSPVSAVFTAPRLCLRRPVSFVHDRRRYRLSSSHTTRRKPKKSQQMPYAHSVMQQQLRKGSRTLLHVSATKHAAFRNQVTGTAGYVKFQHAYTVERREHSASVLHMQPCIATVCPGTLQA
jgi:hypothetical protein